MSITEIRKRLHDYIEKAEDRKIKALYTILEWEIEKMKGLNFEKFKTKQRRMR